MDVNYRISYHPVQYDHGGGHVKYFGNLNDCRVQPTEWIKDRQAEAGWSGYLVCDHLWDPAGPRTHVWTTLGALAATTDGVSLGTGFANNLFRHPIEFAQASLTMQRVSGGRFEAGLGAGWAAAEMEGTGRPPPSAPERAARLIEAVQLVRQVFATGGADVDGEYYQVHARRIERLGGDIGPPALVVGAGGPRVIRGVAPYVDKLEIMPPAVATRTGMVDIAMSNAVSRDDVLRMIDVARAAREDLPLRLYVACCAGTDERSRRISELYTEGFFADFHAEPAKVADAILALGDLGVAELHIAPNDQYSYENLAPRLFR
jgi:alkanesulfonate monooxygenase SsuD/methylene tetrahydromethanopterin reductase-like flavin-dependent oxidoreductase (luciferase family)